MVLVGDIQRPGASMLLLPHMGPVGMPTRHPISGAAGSMPPVHVFVSVRQHVHQLQGGRGGEGGVSPSNLRSDSSERVSRLRVCRQPFLLDGWTAC